MIAGATASSPSWSAFADHDGDVTRHDPIRSIVGRVLLNSSRALTSGTPLRRTAPARIAAIGATRARLNHLNQPAAVSLGSMTGCEVAIAPFAQAAAFPRGQAVDDERTAVWWKRATRTAGFIGPGHVATGEIWRALWRCGSGSRKSPVKKRPRVRVPWLGEQHVPSSQSSTILAEIHHCHARSAMCFTTARSCAIEQITTGQRPRLQVLQQVSPPCAWIDTSSAEDRFVAHHQ